MGSYGEGRTILVAYDFSDPSRRALDRALELAEALRSTVRLLHVVDTSGVIGGGPVGNLPEIAGIANQIRSGSAAELERVADAADPGRSRIGRVDVREGRAADTIAAFAREERAALIVVGTRGRTGLPRLLLGSVAERVARLAPCDVLVVHEGDPG